MDLYEKIKSMCQARGTTIAQMERAAGVANGIVDDWKTSNPRIDSLRKVANALGVRVGDLLGE